MTAPDTKAECTTETPARRTYASLFAERGYRPEESLSMRRWTVSIRPMETRTYWRHVEGTGRYNAAGSLYEEV